MSMSKIVVTGRVARAPEKRFTPNGNMAVTEFSIAVESPARPDGTVEVGFVKVVAWRDLAERCAAEIKKGDLVAVDGRLQLNNYTSSEGQRRKEAEIEASAVENLSDAKEPAADFESATSSEKSLEKTGAKVGARTAGRPQEGQKAGGDDFDTIFASEDEIPF